MKYFFNVFLSLTTACSFLIAPIRIQADEVCGEINTEIYEETSCTEASEISTEVCDVPYYPKSNIKKYLFGAAIIAAVAAGVGGYYAGNDPKTKKIRPQCPVCPDCPTCPTNCGECPTCSTCPACPTDTVNSNVNAVFTFHGDTVGTNTMTISYALVSPDGNYRNDSITVVPNVTTSVSLEQGPPLSPGVWKIVVMGVNGASPISTPVLVVDVFTSSGLIASQTFNTVNPGDVLTLNFTIP
ncbi:MULTISPECIES: hypothetical protein [Parachlamydia]|uniref:hypothetical protein n=1 Tax=Parachlamydia TaxID=83551 RepID=UPI0001C17571|nr:hypothetical protein [Parachlamydia acanthamoebae]EFB40712.1 hypothetical protein pah_c197o108 [Parachlamydia acanthamoebae str. Hall's coccus]